MFEPSTLPAAPFAERLRTEDGRRTFGISLALLIEALLLLLLLSLGPAEQPGKKETSIAVVNLSANDALEEAAEEAPSKREQRAEEQPVPQKPVAEQALPPSPIEPPPLPPTEAVAAPAARPVLPAPPALPASPSSPIRPSLPGQVYGPPDKGGGSASRDTERVGTAPNGEPLYAAAWYREPREDEMRAYLSTARGPGWGLIACRTAPDYRVEDCVPLSEYPEGSQINRAVLAAAWEFKVRPPRIGGRSLVGSWVRIRIDYGMGR